MTRSTRTVALMLAVAVLAGGGAGAAVAALDGGGSTTTKTVTAAAAQPAATKTSGLSVDQIYQQSKQGVVDVKVTDNGSSSGPFGGSGSASTAEGSGFVIDSQGDIVTNQHVVSGASSIEVTFADGSKASAKLVGSDSSTDVAVIRVNVPSSKLHPLTFADSSSVQVGDGVVAIGSPFGLAGSVTTGVVSALGRTIQAPNHFTITGAIQTDAAINHGNSGGPLLSASGQVIGVNAQIESDSGGSDGVGFAIPSNTVKKVAQQLVAGGTVTHAYLGVQVTGSGSATVASVRSGSPAAKAGLRQGDVITAIDGKAVASSDALVTAIEGHSAGDKVTLTVKRGGTTSTMNVTLTSQPT